MRLFRAPSPYRVRELDAWLDGMRRKSPRPQMLKAVLDSSGRTVATVPLEPQRPDGPWTQNGRKP